MKLDNDTLQVLKNFSAINKNIMFKPGNVIRTISSTKSVLAKATYDRGIDIHRLLGGDVSNRPFPSR